MVFCVKCGEDYSPKRRALGYRTCLDCGSPAIKPCIIPVAKSNYVVGPIEDLKGNHKGLRTW